MEIDPKSIVKDGIVKKSNQQILFAQVACKLPEDQLMKKRLWGLTAALLGIWIVFIFRHTIGYMYSVDIINDKLYDLKLITASDYTATGVITPKQWKYFKENLLFTVEDKALSWIAGLGGGK